MPSPSPFRLPEDGTQYARLIFSRCKEFVRTKIWSGIDVIRFDRWLATFNDPLQQHFAACVLDRLIYRSSVVAIYSAVKHQSVLAGLLLLGDFSIQGNIKSLRSLAEPLPVGMANGCARALIPLDNKRNFLEVSGDIVE